MRITYPTALSAWHEPRVAHTNVSYSSGPPKVWAAFSLAPNASEAACCVIITIPTCGSSMEQKCLVPNSISYPVNKESGDDKDSNMNYTVGLGVKWVTSDWPA